MKPHHLHMILRMKFLEIARDVQYTKTFTLRYKIVNFIVLINLWKAIFYQERNYILLENAGSC